jgi:hypothetical protein
MRLGFTVGARNRHAWGTHNHIVQLPGFFVELLAVAEPERIPESGPRAFSFGAFNRDFLAREEGLSMLVLEGRDAEADAAAFKKAGIGDFDTFRFEREAKRPDGSAATVAFTLAFARDPLAQAGFFVSQQHYPENFWNPAFQRHANGAVGVAGVVLVAENPTDHHVFLSAFAGERDIGSSSSGITVTTPRGIIQAMDPTAFRLHFGVEAPDISRGARLAALRFAVRDVAATAAAIARGGIKTREQAGRLVVGPAEALGATLVFEAAAAARG